MDQVILNQWLHAGNCVTFLSFYHIPLMIEDGPGQYRILTVKYHGRVVILTEL